MLRYALYSTALLRDRFSLTQGLPRGIRPHYTMQPAMEVPAIIARDGERYVVPMIWGLLPKGTANTNSIFRYKTHTTPSEKLLSHHSREQAVRQSRCLVPADGYYELISTSEKKQAYYIHAANEPVIAFAGIYTEWQDDIGKSSFSLSILTIEGAGDLPGDAAHPVILSRAEETQWLDPAIDNMTDIYDMLRPYPVSELVVDQVTPAVHSKKYNQPDAITPIA